MLASLCTLATGCHHRTQVAYQPPPAPTRSTYRPTPAESTPADIASEAADAPPGFFDDTSGRPTYTETGIASWYGPNYHHHAAADGTVFDQEAMTAAHRTLPLGTTVRVTNVATGQQVLVRITDRGPFAPGRVLDLSMGAAKAVGIYRAGIAQVRVEAFAHNSPDPAGRWAVQTGAFKTERDALDLKAALLDRYRGARVSEFQGPTGFWVRIDPADHAQTDALAIQSWIGAPDPQSQAYLVRID
jgi:rare lipoprotein A